MCHYLGRVLNYHSFKACNFVQFNQSSYPHCSMVMPTRKVCHTEFITWNEPLLRHYIRTRPSKLCETQIFTLWVDRWKIGLGGKCLVEFCLVKKFWWNIFGGHLWRKCHIWYPWTPCFSNIARGTTDPGYWVLNSSPMANNILEVKWNTSLITRTRIGV